MENEVRLIDANKLMQKISRMCDYCKDNGLEDEMSALFQVGDAVIDCPTIGPESLRQKGRWIDTGESYEDEHCRYNYWACSVCENRIAGRYGLHNYCPNCGAKMEECAWNGC